MRVDRGDRVLEDQLVGVVDFDNHREAIEMLDASLELAAIEEADRHGQTVPACGVEEQVLDIGLCCRPGFGQLRRQVALLRRHGIDLQSMTHSFTSIVVSRSRGE